MGTTRQATARAINLRKIYGQGETTVRALAGVGVGLFASLVPAARAARSDPLS